MASPATHPMRIGGSYPYDYLETACAIIEEALSEVPRITLEVVASTKFDGEVELEKLVGETMWIEIDIDKSNKRRFTGTCVSIEHLGTRSGIAHLLAEVRPQLWFLDRTTECRVYQNMSALAIIEEILGEYGIKATKVLSGSYPDREYCIQYRETDLSFMKRLMEEEGIYFYHDFKDDDVELILIDDAGRHKPSYPENEIPFQPVSAETKSDTQHVHTWQSSESAVSGKVTLKDYDFEKPKADVSGTNSVPKGKHKFKGKEIYRFPGRVRDASRATDFARVRMEAESARHATWSGEGSAFSVRVGHTFKLTGHPNPATPKEYMVTRARHLLRPELEDDENPAQVKSVLQESDDFDLDDELSYNVHLTGVEKSVQYRAPANTPLPEVPGVQTAVVTGPSGKEIYTDKYGRVKIQFHWDRLGKPDENSSCWVRVMMPWTGKQWGMQSIPRIGNEVVVQFEEGDPDRPLIVGMLYNADNMPPYKLPGNMTQTGIKTWSTPKGGGGFNELLFEDKKDSELVRFQAEKDYEQIVKNDAKIEVGLEKKDKGDMDVTVHRHLKETVKTGDHTFKVETGSQKTEIKKDKDDKIEGKFDTEVKENVTTTILQGNQSTKLKMGNASTELALGNFKVDAKSGAVTITAMQKIELKVGGSSITIDMSGVTIKGPMINVNGDGMVGIKAPMTQVNGNAMLTLKGGITMIN